MSARREAARALALGLFLFSIYLLTYRGGFHSVDEVTTYCVTESLVKFGRFDTDQIAWTQWTTTFSEAQGVFGPDGHVYSKKGLAISLFSAPLYWLALNTPGLGLLQTTFLFNAIVTALTGSILFLFVRKLGYGPGVALLTSLTFGLGTTAWVYSKYLFSEPLSALLLLLAFYLLLGAKGQVDGGRAHLYMAGAGFFSGLAVLCRVNNALALLLFAFLLIAYRISRIVQPPTSILHSLISYLAGLGPGLVAFALYNMLKTGNPLRTGYDLSAFAPSYFWKGLFKLLISPYRGLFVFSPVFVLCFLAFPLFFRRHREEGWACLAIPSLYVLLFTFWPSGEGLSWGPRFLLPAFPFLAIPLATLFDYIKRSAIRNQLSIALAFLLALSGFIQILGVVINPQVYMVQLLHTFPNLDAVEKLEGTSALYDPYYSPILGQMRFFSLRNSDLAWWQPWGVEWMVLIAILVLVLFSIGVLMHHLRERQPVGATHASSLRRKVPLIFGLAMAVAVAGFALSRYYVSDLQFGPMEEGYRRAIAAADEHSRPGDGLVTIAPYHYHVAMNYYKGRLPIYGFAADEPPLAPFAEPLLESILAAHNRLWLLTNGFQPADQANGIERWLAERAFKASDEWFGEARLCLFATPQGEVPTTSLQADFGEEILLRGYDLGEEKARPGSVVRVSLRWQALSEIKKDYTVFLHLIDGEGWMLAQHDGPPVGGYRPTSTWQAGEEIHDRHGLILPDDLPLGKYRLIAGLYDGETGLRLPVRGDRDFIVLAEIEVDLEGESHFQKCDAP